MYVSIASLASSHTGYSTYGRRGSFEDSEGTGVGLDQAGEANSDPNPSPNPSPNLCVHTHVTFTVNTKQFQPQEGMYVVNLHGSKPGFEDDEEELGCRASDSYGKEEGVPEGVVERQGNGWDMRTKAHTVQTKGAIDRTVEARLLDITPLDSLIKN